MGAIDEILAALPQDYQNMYIASAFFFGLIMTIHTMRWATLLMDANPRARGLDWEWLWDKLPREYVPQERRWRTPWVVRMLVTTCVMGTIMMAIFLVSMYWVILVVPWMAAAGYFMPLTEWACEIVRRGRDDVRGRGFWERAGYNLFWFPVQSLRLLPEESLAGPVDPVDPVAPVKGTGKVSARELQRQRREKRQAVDLTSESDTDSDSSSDSDGAPAFTEAAGKGKNKGKEPAATALPKSGKKKRGKK